MRRAILHAVMAYSAVIPLKELVARSELIVVATVFGLRVEGSQSIAMADVEDVWKGSVAGHTVEYVASPGWFACDVSSARKGERVVLFLERNPSDRRLSIAHYGRGRMEIVKDAVRAYEVPLPTTDLATLERVVTETKRPPR
ncbi:MAG TPA: hypothetical protein VF266_22950 [Thermoanaerobaculia bacterium]